MSDYTSLSPTRKALYPIPVWAWVTIAAIVIGVIVLGGFVYDKSISTTVPDLLGKNRSQAPALLSAAGLVLGKVSVVETSAPEGTILAQNPAPEAAAKKGDAVSLRVAVPIPGIAIPDFIGQDATSAVAAAQAAGLLPVKVSVYSTGTVGTVVGTIPAAGVKVLPRGELTLVVSAGTASKSAAVPNVIGLTSESATQSITSAGLIAKAVNGYSDTVATGTIIAQSPQPATGVALGSVVSVLVCKGRVTSAATVPDVTGSKQATAETSVRSANLTPIVIFQNSTKTAGTVISQFPEATTASSAGGQVLLVIAKSGSSLVTVPNLIGGTQGQAETTLSGLGLVPRYVSSVSTGYPLGSVSDQVPAAGTKVPAGVDIVVGIVKGVPAQ
jgi:eukaryotic-like serine/threonine-protein kinase